MGTHQIDLRSDRVSKIESEDVLKRTNQYRSDDERQLQTFKTMQNRRERTHNRL